MGDRPTNLLVMNRVTVKDTAMAPVLGMWSTNRCRLCTAAPAIWYSSHLWRRIPVAGVTCTLAVKVLVLSCSTWIGIFFLRWTPVLRVMESKQLFSQQHTGYTCTRCSFLLKREEPRVCIPCGKLLAVELFTVFIWFYWSKGMVFHSVVTEDLVCWHSTGSYIWLFERDQNVLESCNSMITFWSCFSFYLF